jgi:hypothetical protein
MLTVDEALLRADASDDEALTVLAAEVRRLSKEEGAREVSVFLLAQAEKEIKELRRRLCHVPPIQGTSIV